MPNDFRSGLRGFRETNHNCTLRNKTIVRLDWVGLLAAIIVVKAFRWTDLSFVTLTIVGIAPSVFGPAGLLFLMLSSSNHRLAHLTLL